MSSVAKRRSDSRVSPDGPLHVLMVSPQYAPTVGGYERAAERLSAELVRAGHRVTVLTERRMRAWPPKELKDGVEIRRYFCIPAPRLHMMTSFLGIGAFLLFRGARFDVLHLHQYGLPATAAILIAKAFRKPCVMKVTSTSTGGIASSLADLPRYGRPLARLAHGMLDAFVVTSQAAAGEVRAFAPGRRVASIPNGVDVDMAQGARADRIATRRALALDAGPAVLFVGRLSHAKNPLGLLQAWSLVQAARPDARLMIVGDGEEMADCQCKAAELSLGQSVQFFGMQSDVDTYYRAADVFVLPSHWEGLSNSLIEALSFGLPVVSTAVSGSEDVFAKGDVGELVAVRNPKALADAMLKLLADSDRRRACGQRARAIAQSDFGLGSVAARTVNLYRQLIAA